MVQSATPREYFTQYQNGDDTRGTNQTENSEEDELLPERFLVASGIEEAKAKPDPNECVKKVVEPRKKTHDIELEKDVVCDEDTNRPAEVQSPKGSSEVQLNPGVCVPHDNKERGIKHQD